VLRFTTGCRWLAIDGAVSAATEAGGKAVTDAAVQTVRGAVEANSRAMSGVSATFSKAAREL
jgi:hypothetical protein